MTIGRDRRSERMMPLWVQWTLTVGGIVWALYIAFVLTEIRLYMAAMSHNLVRLSDQQRNETAGLLESIRETTESVKQVRDILWPFRQRD